MSVSHCTTTETTSGVTLPVAKEQVEVPVLAVSGA
jgi:hypothetical protein